jgi:hypothetical protein
MLPLLANAGTPLLIMGGLFLLVGNAVIGVIEGLGHYGWAGYGLRGRRGDELRVVAVETPFFQLEPRHATLLEGGQVVYQLGRWIVLYELETRRLAVMGLGRRPVVLLVDRGQGD